MQHFGTASKEDGTIRTVLTIDHPSKREILREPYSSN